MKSLKTLFSVLLLAILVSSCENDEPLAKVRYQINGLDNSVTQIKYDVIGGTVNVTNLNDFGGGSDSRTLSINILPFTAHLEVAANNNTANAKNYNLIIYVDGVAKANYNLSVPANSVGSGEVEYIVEAN
jgi:hypothetical protein